MDLKPLSAVYEHGGPFVSLYLDTVGAVPQAAQRFDTRWKDLQRELQDAGVDAETRAALDAARGDSPHLQGSTLVLIASRGKVHLTRHLPDAPGAEIVRVAPLPHLIPLVDWARSRIPHLVVLTDRQGADILAYQDSSLPELAGSIDSARHPVHKTGTGGWSALRYEHRVEEDWKASGHEVAGAVTDAARQVDAQLILIAGDVYAIEALQDGLPEFLKPRCVVIEGGRSADGSQERVAEQVMEQLAHRVAADLRRVMADFAKYRGRERKAESGQPVGDPGQQPALNAADGPEATFAALRQGQVATLILTEDVDAGAPAFFGPEALQLAVTAAELRELGVSNPASGSMVDVALRAALAADAGVVVVPGGTPESPQDGIGALLRFTI